MRTSGITEISRTDGIKAMPRGFSGSNNKNFSIQEIAVKLVYSRQQTMKNLLKWRIMNGSDQCAMDVVTVDVLIASKNNVKLVESRTVRSASLK